MLWLLFVGVPAFSWSVWTDHSARDLLSKVVAAGVSLLVPTLLTAVALYLVFNWGSDNRN